MIKHSKTKNGRKLSTFANNPGYIISFSRPKKGVKDVSTSLNLEVVDPLTGKWNRVKLDGRAVSLLRSIIAK